MLAIEWLEVAALRLFEVVHHVCRAGTVPLDVTAGVAWDMPRGGGGLAMGRALLSGGRLCQAIHDRL